jgi:hypothetical protein
MEHGVALRNAQHARSAGCAASASCAASKADVILPEQHPALQDLVILPEQHPALQGDVILPEQHPALQGLDPGAATIVLILPVEGNRGGDERPITMQAQLRLRRRRIVLHEPRVTDAQCCGAASARQGGLDAGEQDRREDRSEHLQGLGQSAQRGEAACPPCIMSDASALLPGSHALGLRELLTNEGGAARTQGERWMAHVAVLEPRVLPRKRGDEIRVEDGRSAELLGHA